MLTTKKRIRIDYAPLSYSVSIVTASADSPCTQTADTATGQYEPDRSATALVLQPVVNAAAADGSFPDGNANHLLTDMHWYSGGVEISTVSDWTGKYSIDTSNSTDRGALTVTRNIPPGESVVLTFSAKLYDSRLNINYPVQSDPVTLTTNAKATPAYTVDVGDSSSIRYDPFYDKLLFHEYRSSHGIASTAPAADDPCNYLIKVPVHVYCGENEVTTGFKVAYFQLVNGIVTPMSEDIDHEIVSRDDTGITLDLRLLQSKKDYLVRVLAPTATGNISDTPLAQCQFTVTRISSEQLRVRTANGTAISPRDTVRSDEALVDYGKNVVQDPEAVLKLTWKTDTVGKTGMVHHEGRTTEFRLADTGIGTGADAWIDVTVEAEPKGFYYMATDGNTYFTDELGNELIFN